MDKLHESEEGRGRRFSVEMKRLKGECRRKAEAEGMASLMNDTKWRELAYGMSALPKLPRWRTRNLLNGYLSDWDCGWFHHLGPNYCSIEWIEIDPADCAPEDVERVMEQVGVPFEKIPGGYKILGYQK